MLGGNQVAVAFDVVDGSACFSQAVGRFVNACIFERFFDNDKQHLPREVSAALGDEQPG